VQFAFLPIAYRWALSFNGGAARIRGPHDRQGAKAESATGFCPGRAIGPQDRPRPCHCVKARLAPPRASAAAGKPRSRSRCDDVAGAAHHSVPDMLLGQRSDPASPAKTKLPILNQQTKETW
jgi:hypothetical protein